MKKIYYHEITMSQSYNEGTKEPIYEVCKEQFQCEYSEEWTEDDEDPIKDYVENMIENSSNESFKENGYSWDENAAINFSTVTFSGASHILFKNGEPIELYYVD